MEDFKSFGVASVSPALLTVRPSGSLVCELLWNLRRELRTLSPLLMMKHTFRSTKTGLWIFRNKMPFLWFLRYANPTLKNSMLTCARGSNKAFSTMIRSVFPSVFLSLPISGSNTTALRSMDRRDIAPIITVYTRNSRKIGTWYSTFLTRSGIKVSSIVNPLNRKRQLLMSRNISSILPWCPYRRPLTGRSRLCPRASDLSILLNREKRGIAKRILCVTMCPYKIGGKSYRGIIGNEFSMMQ